MAQKDRSSTSLLVFTLVDDVDAKGGETAGEGVFKVERLAKTETRGNGTNNGNERIVDSDLAYRIAAEQFVVERESDG